MKYPRNRGEMNMVNFKRNPPMVIDKSVYIRPLNFWEKMALSVV